MSKQREGKGQITVSVQEPQVLTLDEAFFALT